MNHPSVRTEAAVAEEEVRETLVVVVGVEEEDLAEDAVAVAEIPTVAAVPMEEDRVVEMAEIPTLEAAPQDSEILRKRAQREILTLETTATITGTSLPRAGQVISPRATRLRKRRREEITAMLSLQPATTTANRAMFRPEIPRIQFLEVGGVDLPAREEEGGVLVVGEGEAGVVEVAVMGEGGRAVAEDVTVPRVEETALLSQARFGPETRKKIVTATDMLLMLITKKTIPMKRISATLTQSKSSAMCPKASRTKRHRIRMDSM
mmetsp:Transcript_31519/g.73891  ORF Transcript_31519/g.73891 Transcript_31519/m.73891 type:complete len:264 (+) Transcript_31519:189-980(+)